MKQVIEIHERNKQESKEQSEAADCNSETLQNEAQQQGKTLELTQTELDEKLNSFSGVNRGLDEVGKRGQLLEDEAKEAIDVTYSTFQKLYVASGGFVTVMILFLT